MFPVPRITESFVDEVDDEISYFFELRDHEAPFAPKGKSKDFINDVKKSLKSKKKGL